jgi:hypothetical protein
LIGIPLVCIPDCSRFAACAVTAVPIKHTTAMHITRSKRLIIFFACSISFSPFFIIPVCCYSRLSGRFLQRPLCGSLCKALSFSRAAPNCFAFFFNYMYYVLYFCIGVCLLFGDGKRRTEFCIGEGVCL